MSKTYCPHCGASARKDQTQCFSCNQPLITCVPLSALISTVSGQKKLKDIQAGEFVKSVNFKNDVEFRRVKKINFYGHRSVSRITLNSGISVYFTKSHSVLSQRGWMRVSDLKVTDELFLVSPEGMRYVEGITNIELDEYREEVGNLIIEENYTFIAQNCIAHSFSYFRAIRMFIGKLYDWRIRLFAGERSVFVSFR